MYNREYEGDVCSHSHSFFLDNFLRRMFQNPRKIVGEYIKEGDTVIEPGCGPGYFSIDMAAMTGAMGKVYAVDLQSEMLAKVRKKADKYGLTDRMVFHKCSQQAIGIEDGVEADFILAYYMVHEVSDQRRFLEELKLLLKKGGRLLVVEPPVHVSNKDFEKTVEIARELGFSIVDRPKKKGGKAILLTV